MILPIAPSPYLQVQQQTRMDGCVRSAFASRASSLVPLIVFGLFVLLVQPWGNYPVDDDWQYARAAEQFAATGHMVIDTPIAPSLIGQIVIAYPVISAFGFSHTRLRILTLLLSGLIIVLLDRLLQYARVQPVARILALSLFVINPLFGHLAFSFMTEIYGYAVALVAVVLWFRARSQADARAEHAPEAPLISWPAALIVGLLSGVSFWIRQYCVLVLPACIASALIGRAVCGNWSRVRSSAFRLTASLGLALGGVISYIEWAKVSGNLKPQFTEPLLHGSALLWPVHVGIFITYMTAFFLPLLLLLPRYNRERWTALSNFILVLIGIQIAILLYVKAPGNAFFALGFHKFFPFLSGIAYNACVGPPTLSDVFISKLPNYPHWPEWTWIAIEVILLAANGLWTRVFKDTQTFVLRTTCRGIPTECLLFGFLFAGSSFFASVIGSGTLMFDRYYFPCVIGLIVVTAILLTDNDGQAVTTTQIPSLKAVRVAHVASLVAFAALAFFSVAGMHDYFRWNDARWSEVRSLLNAGVSPANIDGGYEVNGWLLFGRVSTAAGASKQCIGGRCRCAGSWYCFDDSYRIGMNVYDGYEIVTVQQPEFWLTKPYPIVVSRRTR